MKKIISTILISLFIFTGCNINNPKTKNPNAPQKKIIISPQQTILYHNNTCSHCIKVLEFMNQQGINSDKHIILKKPYQNKEIYQEFLNVIQTCHIPVYQIGIPLLWDDGKCYTGDQEIITHWKNNNNIKF